MLAVTAVAGVERYDMRVHERTTPAVLAVIVLAYALPNLLHLLYALTCARISQGMLICCR
jgi:hypothetical protein